jgi:hypothetical protein
MIWTDTVPVDFSTPPKIADVRHHSEAASANNEAAQQAILALSAALSDGTTEKRILLRAAAGAGKSFQLQQMVQDALAHPACVRVAVAAFQNRQIWPLANRLGQTLGSNQVCLLSGRDRVAEAQAEVGGAAAVVSMTNAIPSTARVVIATSHKLGAIGERNRHLAQLGPGGNNDKPYDVLFVDEAWQMAMHLFAGVSAYAPIIVGVGDVGQLPPIEVGANPWRGDRRYNPYRAWPTAFERDPEAFKLDLPAVWRPHGNQLGLWRAFYRGWDRLDCVAAPEDRTIELPTMNGAAARVWETVATGHPTLLELDGLDDPEAPDIDQPLLQVIKTLLTPLLAGGFAVVEHSYDASGKPDQTHRVSSAQPTGDPLIVLLATRNAAVDDAQAIADQLNEDLGLPDGVIQASTVDRWQGQTNRITIAIHPLSGADALDDFNSAFGRLAVACTRATHGLLLVTRQGIEDLLADAPARPGTPFGEPGTRTLPRQTHGRILNAFARGVLDVRTL